MSHHPEIYSYEATVDDVPDWILQESFQSALDRIVEESQLEFIRKQQMEREIIEQQNLEYEAAVEADRRRIEAMKKSGVVLHIAVSKIDGKIAVVEINSMETLDNLFHLVDDRCRKIKIGRQIIDRSCQTLESLGVTDRQLLRMVE